MIEHNGTTIRIGDFVKVQPLDPLCSMIISPMMLISGLIEDQALVSASGTVIDLTMFRVIYQNGKELDKYHTDLTELNVTDHITIGGVTEYDGDLDDDNDEGDDHEFN
jgi:hypothetical protein